MIENWARLSGFAAILAAVLATSFLWALNYAPPQNTEWTCEAKPNANDPNKPALNTFTCHTKQSENLESQSARANKQSDQNASDGIKITDIFLSIFNALLVIVTAVLIAVGIGQGRELKRAVDVAEKSDEILQRAYLWPGYGESDPLDDGTRRKWHIRVHNTGQTAGIIQTVNYTVKSEEIFKAGWNKFTRFKGREDVIPPSLGKPYDKITGAHFTIDRPQVCWGWIEYQDVFGKIQRQGWKHLLNLKPDAAGNYSNPFPGCYSKTYEPWINAKIEREEEAS
jgi:hypothetical protein